MLPADDSIGILHASFCQDIAKQTFLTCFGTFWESVSSRPLSPSIKLLSPCPTTALSSEEREQSTHHSIHMSLAHRSSHRSPASKGVQGECLPPSQRERFPIPFPPGHPLPSLLGPHGKPQATLSLLVARWLPHQAAAGLGALLRSQPARGKTEAA